MAPYIPPHRRPAPSQQADDAYLPPRRLQGHHPQSSTPARPTPPSDADNTTGCTPVWRRGAAAGPGPLGSGAARPNLLPRRPPGPGLSIADSIGSSIAPRSPFTTPFRARPAPRIQQTADEAQRYISFERFCLTRQPKPIRAEECEENKEYAQWAGGYVEVNDKLLSEICPCNLVGKPCPLDELEDSCPMIRLCGQLEKWTIHKCPDKGFRTISDAAENIPADYGEKGFGAVNYYDSSDNESGGVALDSSINSETDSPDADVTDLEPNYNGKKVSFNDFSCGVSNSCGHIHWEVEINCRFVGWFHYKNIPCKQVLDKGRLCSVGHDLESARQSARDAVAAHERSAERVGVPQARDTGKIWVY